MAMFKPTWDSLVKRKYKIKVGPGYYIHHYHKNINRINTNGKLGQSLNANQIANAFKSEKAQIKTTVLNKYTQLFATQIKDGDADFMALLTNPSRGSEYMTALNNAIAKELQENLDTNKIIKLLKIERKNPRMSKGQQAILNNYIKGSTKTKQGCEYINKYIKNIAEAIQLLDSIKGNEFAAALIAIEKQGALTAKQYSNTLKQICNQYKKDLEGEPINGEKVLDVLQKINVLADRLAGVDSKGKKKDFSALGIQKIVENQIFSEVIGEWLGLNISESAIMSLQDAIKKKTGQDTNINLVLDDTEIQDSGAQGKADIKLENVKFSFNAVGDYKKSVDLKVDIGISNKLYKTGNWYNKETKQSSDTDFSLGNGMKLRDAINLSLSSENKKYLAYNTFAWEDEPEMERPLIALQDIIFKRSLINIAAARGGKKDFSMMLLLNGEFVPLWDLVQLALNKNMGFSSSMGNSNFPLTFSISTTQKNADKFTYQDSLARGLIKINKYVSSEVYKYDPADFNQDGTTSVQYAKKIVKLINHRAELIYNGMGKAKITAHINPSKLRNLKT